MTKSEGLRRSHIIITTYLKLSMSTRAENKSIETQRDNGKFLFGNIE